MASLRLLSALNASLATRHETRHAGMLVAVRDHLSDISAIPQTKFSQAATSCALGQGPAWLPIIYRHAIAEMPSSTAPTAFRPADEQNQRRAIYRMLKEVLLKCVILIGVARPIESMLALGEATDPADLPSDDDDGFRSTYRLDEANSERGRLALERVYAKNLGAIFARFEAIAAPELKWISNEVTYGLLLAPCSDTPDAEPRAPLSFAETEIVALSCLAAQKSAMTTLWHLRGSLRSGLTRDEVERIQQAIEQVAAACGVQDLAAGMPRVAQVSDEEI